MATTITVPRTTRLPTHWNLADIQNHVGGVPLNRILSFPPPGFATVEDVLWIRAKTDALCELIDGILVEKTLVFWESSKRKVADGTEPHTMYLRMESDPTARTVTTPRSTRLPTDWTLADIQEHVGGVPLERIRAFPPPGFATVEDVEILSSRKEAICELIDGILVEKTMGWYESFLAMLIGTKLNTFVIENQLGLVLGADGARNSA